MITTFNGHEIETIIGAQTKHIVDGDKEFPTMGEAIDYINTLVSQEL